MSYPPDDWSGKGSEDGANARDLSRLQDDELESSIVAMLRQIDALQTQVAQRAAEYDRRGLARERHVLTTKQWLAHVGRLTPSQAATMLRSGRALERMPATAKLAASGHITATAVRKLTAAFERHPDAYPLHEAVLADAATHLSPSDLRKAIDHWEQQVAYPTAIAEIEAKARRRRLSINQTWDGMWALSGELDPESGHVVATTLRAKAEEARLDDGDGRTNAQAMADALTDVCRFGLDHDDGLASSGGVKPHIAVTIDYSTLVGKPTDAPLPEMDDLHIDPEAVRRLACDADVVRIITGPDSAILDVGRSTRTVPAAVRRALDHRDGGCTWAGCDAPPSWCDAHHIEHWADGGHTNLENLVLLCRRHHSATHEPTRRDRNRRGHDPP